MAGKQRDDSEDGKKPSQEPYVPRPDLGESGDVNAIAPEREALQTGETKKSPSQNKPGSKPGDK